MAAQLPKWLVKTSEGTIARLYVQPNASRSEIVGEHGSDEGIRLKVRIAAPAVDSAANEELLHFLKKLLRISASKIQLLRGNASRSKDVLFLGISAEDLLKLAPLQIEMPKPNQ